MGTDGRVVVIVNAGAGSVRGASPSTVVEEALRRHGLDATARAVPGGSIGAAARQAVEGGARVVVAAGGDGTVSAVAAQVAGTDAALGVLPLGTLNHFAHDAAIPLDLDAAAAALASGEEVALDVGRVNGVAFVNNATVGLYPDQVRVRHRWRRFLGKWPAAVVASFVVLWRFRSMRLSIDADGAVEHAQTPLVVVSNNPYGLEAGRPHGRPRIQGGRLGLYVVGETGRFGLVKTAMKSLVVSLEGDATFTSSEVRRVQIASRRRRLHVALDGEVVKMKPPLRFESAPGALRVRGAGAAKRAAAEVAS